MPLYIVGTPIGNLEDISQRAIKTLKDADIIYCEDTRISRILLDKFFIKTRLCSLFLKQMVLKKDEIISHLIKDEKVAIISDAGMPIISDPGFDIVKICHEKGIKVIPVGGSSSIISALVSSGLCPNPFLFLGFLPRSVGDIKKELLKYSYFKGSIIILESPRRVLKTLEIIKQVYNNCKVSFSRELTKIYEEIKTDTIDNIISYLKEKEQIKGEFVLVVEKNEIVQFDISLNDRLTYYILKGLTKNEAIKQIAKDLNVSKKQVYEQVLKEDIK